MTPLRVAILVDVRLYRQGLAEALGRHADMRVVLNAERLAEALSDIRRASPDVALVDTAVDNSLEIVRTIAQAMPEVGTLALGVEDSDAEVIAYAEAGVAGYVTRNDSIADLVAAIRSVARGETLCSPKVAATLLRRVAAMAGETSNGDARLTTREVEVVELIDEGLTNKEIARRLCIQLPTVKNHVHHVLEKLHARHRTEAAAVLRARRRGAGGPGAGLVPR